MLTNFQSAESVIDCDITRAKTLPTKYYLDPKYFELAKEKIFSGSWQFITDTHKLKEAGQVVPQTLLEGYLNEPILLTRDANDDIHCLSNVCTHRGTVLVEGECHTQQMRCRYHGRRFGLDGKFISAPGFEEVCNFPSEADNLTSISMETFGQFIFASINPSIPFDDLICDMQRRLGWLPLDEFVFDASRSRDYIINAHWALWIENALEGFHIPYVHPSLGSYVDIKTYRTEIHKYGNLQIGMAQKTSDAFNLPEQSPDYGQDIAGYYYWFFPNTTFNFYPWGLSINSIQPLAIDRTRVRYLTYVWDSARMKSYSPEDVDQTEKEDDAIIEQVQRGIQSSFYNRGRYSPKWETGVHQFHTLMTEYLQD